MLGGIGGLGRLLLPALVGTCLVCAPAAAQTPDVPTNAGKSGIIGYVKGRVLAQPRAGLEEREFDDIIGKHRGKRARRIRDLNVDVIELDSADNEMEVVKALRRGGKMKFAELDMIVAPAQLPSDPRYSTQWHLPKIGAPRAWDFAVGDGVIVAILDTGVDGAHPDLAPQMVPGWNIYNNNADTADIQGHGTAVAGTAAAAGNNAVGVAGVNWRARIMPIRIADANGYATFSSMAAGINWAANNGARVANISYSGAAGSATVQSAAQYMRGKGGVVVVSAENTGTQLTYAASPYLTVVSATDSNDVKASWSSYGNYVDVAAPGAGIVTTSRGGTYGSWSGTSFSSPVTAGVYGLMIAANPDLPPATLDSILTGTALDIGGAGYDAYYGYGRVNAAEAVEAARNSVVGDSQPPSVSITAPAAGSRLSGTAAVDVAATDNVGVARVELYANGSLVASDASSPYGFAFDTKGLADGAATLQAKAYDAAGNVGSSASVAVTIANDVTLPSVAITSPTSGTTVATAQTVTVATSATDNVAVTKVEFFQNGVLKGSKTAAPYTYAWTVSSANNGISSWTARAYDAAGNAATSAAVSVTVAVAADTTPPKTTIGNPLPGSTVARYTTITASATDNVKVTSLQLYIDGTLRSSTTASTLNYTWNTRRVATGTHTIRVLAKDAAGNQGESTVQVVK